MAKLLGEFRILGNGKYLGMLFQYEAGWTHSIANHGSSLLPTSAAAEHDFFDTKQRLPSAVHRVIFGEN